METPDCLVPLAVLWASAYMLWRAADMRQVSEALFQSAMRLIRPQDIFECQEYWPDTFILSRTAWNP